VLPARCTILTGLERSRRAPVSRAEVLARTAVRPLTTALAAWCTIITIARTERTIRTILARFERSLLSPLSRTEILARTTVRTRIIAFERRTIPVFAKTLALAAIRSRRRALVAGRAFVAELPIAEFFVAAPRTCRPCRTVAAGTTLATALIALTRSAITARRTAVVFIVVAGHE
jgi:hypothetical protein